jgi:hypothetical protein
MENQHRAHHGEVEEAEKCAHHTPGDNNINDACCSVDLQTLTINATSRAEVKPAEINLSAVVILTPRFLPEYPRTRAVSFIDSGPPTLASPPKRILIAQFLN